LENRGGRVIAEGILACALVRQRVGGDRDRAHADDQLSRILRLTHGGPVRLVDRLVERNLVDKQPTAIDRRIMTLALTPSGLQLRDKLLALRRDALAALLKRVSPEDLAPLERIAEIIVAALPENALSALTTCRYCDERSCIDRPMEVFGPLETPGSSTATA
jgi:DNA-binding MarR family transcriptional regulator